MRLISTLCSAALYVVGGTLGLLAACLYELILAVMWAFHLGPVRN